MLCGGLSIPGTLGQIIHWSMDCCAVVLLCVVLYNTVYSGS